MRGRKASLQAFVCSFFFSFTAKPFLLRSPTILNKIEISFRRKAIFNKSSVAFKVQKKNDCEKEDISSHVQTMMYILYCPQAVTIKPIFTYALPEQNFERNFFPPEI